MFISNKILMVQCFKQFNFRLTKYICLERETHCVIVSIFVCVCVCVCVVALHCRTCLSKLQDFPSSHGKDWKEMHRMRHFLVSCIL